MKIVYAITTAPRPIPTLERSLASMRAAGINAPVPVFSDGPCTVSDAAAIVIENTPPLGGLRNWCHALERVTRETNAEWIAMLEDDILWAQGSGEALLRDLDHSRRQAPDIGYLSLYLPSIVSRSMEREQMRVRLRPGYHRSRMGNRCWGSQAYVLPRHAAEALLADPTFQDYRQNYAKNRNRDNIVSGCLSQMGRQLLYRVPCLVSHELGSANSSLGDKPVQRGLLTRYWTGFA